MIPLLGVTPRTCSTYPKKEKAHTKGIMPCKHTVTRTHSVSCQHQLPTFCVYNVCVCAGAHGCTCRHAHLYRGQKLTADDSLNHFTILFILRHSLSLNWNLPISYTDWLQISSCLYSPAAGFLIEWQWGDLNIGPHALYVYSAHIFVCVLQWQVLNFRNNKFIFVKALC